MKALFISIGSRGDMEPFLAIAEILHQKGHDVKCQFPEQFRALVEDSGFAFSSLGTEFLEMLYSDDGKYIMGGGATGIKKLMAYIRLVQFQAKNNKKLVQLQKEEITNWQPDIIIHNGKAMYPVFYEIDHPGSTIYISPVPYLHYVKGHTHAGFHSNYGDFLNKFTYQLADFGVTQAVFSAAKKIGENHRTKKQIKQVFQQQHIIYTVSPQLFPKPAYWPNNMKVLGYHERNKTSHWAPSIDLLNFLDKHPKLLFVTFGSMTNPEPLKKTQTLLEVLGKQCIPAIVNTAEGGLQIPDTYNQQLFYFVEQIPYDFIFSKMYGVIHHGGSGTTHMAIKNGCASMIIPHIIDQFNWNNLISERNLGPKGPKISDLNTDNLSHLVKDLWQNPSYKQNALKTAAAMQHESELKENLYQAILNQINNRKE